MQEEILLNATLCFLVKENKVLLAMKTKKIGQGCWNGYGGGIEPEETPEQCALRELNEEAKITISLDSLEKVAIISFHNTKTDGSAFTCKVHVYLASEWKGEIQSTDEMTNPTWFEKDQLPLQEMMPADKEWLPVVLSGKKIIAEVNYGPLQKTLLGKVKLQYVDSFLDK